MGHNSLIFLCNDVMGYVDKDPSGWWKITDQQIMEAGAGFDKVQDYGFGSAGNGFSIPWNRHADFIGIIAVGGNYATVLHSTYAGNLSHHTPEDKLRIVKEMARDLGYDLRERRDTEAGSEVR